MRLLRLPTGRFWTPYRGKHADERAEAEDEAEPPRAACSKPEENSRGDEAREIAVADGETKRGETFEDA